MTDGSIGTFGENVVDCARGISAGRSGSGPGDGQSESRVVCGRTLGDNVRRRGHTQRQINVAEAAIVRQIFERSASGCYTRIARQLNADWSVTLATTPAGGRLDRLRGAH